MRTGDVGYFDEEGFLVHVSRVDDVFKVSGMWVSPLAVEDSLLTHEAVQDAAVIPKQSESVSQGLCCAVPRVDVDR